MPDIDEELCKKFSLDPKKVASIARRISKAALEAEALGLEVFGGSGTGSLRYYAAEVKGPGHNDVASLDGCFDGGDGGDVYS